MTAVEPKLKPEIIVLSWPAVHSFFVPGFIRSETRDGPTYYKDDIVYKPVVGFEDGVQVLLMVPEERLAETFRRLVMKIEGEEYEDAFVCGCNWCGAMKPCELVNDPYIAEICSELDNELEWWCKPCFDSRASEI